MPSCVFFIWDQKGGGGSVAGDAFFCNVDYFGEATTPDDGWMVGGRVK